MEDKLILRYKCKDIFMVDIFSLQFVENNKDNCQMIVYDKTIPLSEKVINKDYYSHPNISELEVTLTNISTIENIKKIFSSNLLITFEGDVSKLNTSNITDMSRMFNSCSSLISLPSEISKWDTSNITNISSLFGWCLSLKTIPDISNWNTSKITDMISLFDHCQSLESLPDISKWDTSNVTNMNYLFASCESLESLPDISKWNTSKVMDMSNLFDV